MLKRIGYGVVIHAALLNPAVAACPTFPYSFSNGSTADANQINGNFSNVTNCFAPINNPAFTGVVGIGISSPQYSSTLQTIGGIVISNSSGSVNGGLEPLNGNFLAIEAFNNGNTSKLPLALAPYGGSVGIGTTSPSYALQVASGPVAGAGAYVNTSDGRLKKDIEPIAYGIDAVMKLTPIGFNWRDQSHDWQKPHQLGLIAQDVVTVIPEVVSAAGDEQKTLGLAYGELVPVLIKAIQDQQAEIAQLKADLAAIQNGK